MLRDHVLKLLRVNQEELKRFNVQAIYLFGSVARGEERADSDIDILVAFEGLATFDQYMDLKFYLEALFLKKVDLITETGLREEIKSYIKKDLIRAA